MKARDIVGPTLLTLTVVAACTLPAGALMAQAPSTMAADTDNDKTLDLNEAKTAASAKFDKLNKDSDGTLDMSEIKRVLGPAAFKAADTDHDGTLDKNEYLALVEKQFKRADTDGDGTLDVKELNATKAAVLRKLIR